MSDDAVRQIGAEQVPYFRTPEFSAIMLENEKLVKQFAGADQDARVCFMTGSGTASMEAAVMNLFTPQDRVLVIDPGEFSFGHRFAEMLRIHEIPYSAIVPEFGHGVTAEQLAPYDGKGYTGFLVNLDETVNVKPEAYRQDLLQVVRIQHPFMIPERQEGRRNSTAVFQKWQRIWLRY